MIKRASPLGESDNTQRQTDLVELIERALQLASELGQHRTAAALDDAVIQAQKAITPT